MWSNSTAHFTGDFLWKARGGVASLDALDAQHGLTAKQDLATAVGERKHSLPVVELAGGKVIGDLRLASTRNDVVIGDLQTIFGCQDPAAHYALRKRRLRMPWRRHGRALLLGAANSDNYYHWLLESLPRWHLLQLAGYQKYDYVLLHSQPRPFQDEMLDRLEVPKEKRLRCSKNFVHQFDQLIVPAMPAPPWEARGWIVDWIRLLFTPEIGGPEKIYLSRRNVQRRRLSNEPEIEAQLQGLGFVSIQPEQLTVAEQAKIFMNARSIVAPHGAGLANLAFTPPGARVVELFHPDIVNPCYKNLAAACGHHYASFTGTRLHDSVRHDEQAEYTVEVPALLRIMSESNMILT